MVEEPVPVVLSRDRIVRPVGRLRIDEDDPRVFVLLVGIGPDVVVAVIRAGLREPGALEPRMLVGRMVDDQFRHHANTARMRFLNEALDVGERAVIRMHIAVIGDVISIVAPGRPLPAV